MTVHVEVTETELDNIKKSLGDLVESPLMKDLLVNSKAQDLVVRATLQYGDVVAHLSISSRK